MSSGDLIPNDHDHVEAVANEIQFALVITRVIDTLKNSPEHMRQAVYDLARYKVQERFTKILKCAHQQALEKAIRSVEEFSRQQIDIPLPSPARYSETVRSRAACPPGIWPSDLTTASTQSTNDLSYRTAAIAGPRAPDIRRVAVSAALKMPGHTVLLPNGCIQNSLCSAGIVPRISPIAPRLVSSPGSPTNSLPGRRQETGG